MKEVYYQWSLWEKNKEEKIKSNLDINDQFPDWEWEKTYSAKKSDPSCTN